MLLALVNTLYTWCKEGVNNQHLYTPCSKGVNTLLPCVTCFDYCNTGEKSTQVTPFNTLYAKVYKAGKHSITMSSPDGSPERKWKRLSEMTTKLA